MIDTTCGSGGFLIKTFEYIREKIEEDIREKKKEIIDTIFETSDYDNLNEEEQIKINHKIDKITESFNNELDTLTNGSRLQNLSSNCIYGVDANPRMARTSKMNMIMHGDGHGGIHHHEGLLNVNGIFEERFDVILTNPPFGSSVDKNQLITEEDIFKDEKLIEKYTKKYGEVYKDAQSRVNNNIGEPVINLYEVGKLSSLTEVVFIDRCLNLLKKGGRLGIVLPDGVLNNQNMQKVREYFEGRAKIVLVCSIPQDVFGSSKATVKPSLVFLKKFTENEETEYNNAKLKAKEKIRMNYLSQIEELNLKISEIDSKDKKQKTKIDTANKKQYNRELKEIDKKIEEESKIVLKDFFDYEIAFAKVDKAGITNTGAECENELIEVLAEFRKYETENSIWEKLKIDYKYSLDEDGNLRKEIL
ncbi:HsdM family class I SAM-dependent methyltransferase [Clostridium perfringens]|uniref:HsdM family class I SAM-dependent methyltransferase n=1 Tax=Clostridium perfringens TaxID=1502 RepID=UPI0039ECC506